MPLIPFIIIGVIIYVMVTVRKAQQLEAQKKAAHEQVQRHISGEKPAEDPLVRARRQEELKRRLQENAARREAERAREAAASPARPTERRPLEKQTLQTALGKEKPVVAHEDDDCGGGSIHDGYHEGVTQFSQTRPAAVAGNLGHRLADEDERIEKEHAAAESAKRAMARISKLPPLAQGMIYSEILGKPRSETA